jgi:hypothetical protein
MIQSIIQIAKKVIWGLIIAALVFIYEKGCLTNNLIIAVLVILFGIFLIIKLELNEEVPDVTPNQSDAPPTPTFKPMFTREESTQSNEPKTEYITKRLRYKRSRSKSPAISKKSTTCNDCNNNIPTLSLT